MKTEYLFVILLVLIGFSSCEDSTSDATLELSQSTFENISSDGATLTVNITSSDSWTAASSSTACNLVPNQGTSNQSLSIVVEANLDEAERNMTVVVSGLAFFEEQTYTGIAVDSDTNEIVGLYILHPNNVGRCGHICNASYAVSSAHRGKQIGEFLVTDCIKRAPEFDFKILQFNAVVASNKAALHLYKKLGFIQLGIIPKGFLLKDGTYEDIIPHYLTLIHS